MTELERDHFDQVRRELLAATRRSAQRARRRRQNAVIIAATLSSIVLITGIAAAANERVASFVGSITGVSVGDVFEGDPQITEPPSDRTQEMLHDMEELNRGLNPEAPNPDANFKITPRVLLRDEFKGVDVEIVGYERPVGSPSHFGPRKQAETCYSVLTDPPKHGGGVTCTPAFMPGLPVNYGVASSVGCDEVSVTIAGIAANSVRAVRIDTEDGVEEALMGDGAFYWHSSTAAPVQISVERIDGTFVTKRIESGPSPQTLEQMQRNCPVE